MKTWIKKELLRNLMVETQNFLPYETGGILLGYKTFEGDTVISELIPAGPNARHERHFFIPDGDFQQNQLEKFYYSSNGVITYLGDWHSHPYHEAYMSILDRKTIKKIANTASSQIENPIFIIIGTLSWEVKCWRYDEKSNENLEQVHLIAFSN